jgi:hypothetical protein
VASAADTDEAPSTKRINNMKTLTKLALAAVMLTAAAISAQAEWVSGHFRGNGTYVAPYYRSSSSLGSYSASSSSHNYVYHNPYAATPSVKVHDYFKSDGTYVLPHVRTSPNWTTTDNLSYRGYGTIRVPRHSSGW